MLQLMVDDSSHCRYNKIRRMKQSGTAQFQRIV
jgi:hypothetical protein